MVLKFRNQTNEIEYNGKIAGKFEKDGDKTIVKLHMQYEAGDDWMVPLSWFAKGLALLPENQPSPVIFSVETFDDDIEEKFDVPRGLTEKQIKVKGHKWSFHKTDSDDWPSVLHGHDYDNNLKLDAITGDIYDVMTRNKCEKLKSKSLKRIQNTLRSSDDFKDRVVRFIDEEPNIDPKSSSL
ncbi:hypothetical protein [Gluconobacter sp. P1D12_c]|uniref:hypothetical protein n=1 Tax=Gluconobacter sp. P1D12_c TaxID=2762614 RepID=UPI001C04484B|nr:hypothetical protein [Gluconobacter sp. P1D12_c]